MEINSLIRSINQLNILVTNFSFDDKCFQNDYDRQYFNTKFVKKVKLILSIIIFSLKVIQIKNLSYKFNDKNITKIIISYLI